MTSNLANSKQALWEVWERPTTRLLSIVVVTGLAGGLVGAAYLGLLKLVQHGLWPTHWSLAAHLVVLVVVGAVVAGLTRWLGSPSDVELLVDDIHVLGGAEDLRSLRSLVPVSLLCVGAGGALGPEAPLVTATGSLGSWIGTRARLERDDLRVVSIAGMAAGFTVLFGAPLGSALFALEILHRRGLEYYEALLPAVIGSLCGYVVYAAATGVGLEPVFRFPTTTEVHLADLGYGVGAGVVGALVAAAFTYLCVGLKRVVGRVPVDARPVLGGLALGGLAFATPYALTNGEVQVEHLTGVRVAAATLLLAAGMKLVASAVTLVTGWKGGFIIPLFFIGFCLAQAAAPHLPGADRWVLAAGLMVACNVGVTKTPIGSTLVVTEMAGLALLPSVLVAAVVSLALTSSVGLIDSQRQRLTGDEEPGSTS
ncbi:chloride channel protein [Aquihabitans sp. G128]|uniref:chloride channel protein n=1 Tax=Aquihabitans sp. G128 TaxID=2849779 RepID=UPI0020B1852B|nr:chloride channel protein [Aquihabitans sp. G128]